MKEAQVAKALEAKYIAKREELANKPARFQIEANPEFGENFPKYYHDGIGAINKLLEVKRGQVAGAFYREELGDIDLVWGAVTNAEKHTGYGLAHIVDKHPEAVNKIPEIIKKGKLLKDNGIYTIYDKDYRVGLSKGWNNKGDNHWIISSYKTETPHSDFLPSNGVASEDGTNLLPNVSVKSNSTTNPPIPPKKINETLKNAKTIGEQHIIDDRLHIDEKMALKLIDRDLLKPNFNFGTGTQLRLDDNSHMIRNIQEDFDPRMHFDKRGGFNGTPVVSIYGDVIAGNHRLQAIQNMNPAQYTHYKEELIKRYPEAKAMENPILVRLLESGDNETIMRMAKVSNESRVRLEGEKQLIAMEQYKPFLDQLPPKLESTADLMQHIGSKERIEAQRALLAYLNKDIPFAISEYEKAHRGAGDFARIFNENAYLLHNLKNYANNNEMPAFNLTSLIPRAIRRLNHLDSKSRPTDDFSAILQDYQGAILKPKGVQTPLMDVSDTLNHETFPADMLAVAIKRLQNLKDDGVSDMANRLNDLYDTAKLIYHENHSPKLFDDGNIAVDIYDVVRYFINGKVDLENEDFTKRMLNAKNASIYNDLVDFFRKQELENPIRKEIENGNPSTLETMATPRGSLLDSEQNPQRELASPRISTQEQRNGIHPTTRGGASQERSDNGTHHLSGQTAKLSRDDGASRASQSGGDRDSLSEGAGETRTLHERAGGGSQEGMGGREGVARRTETLAGHLGESGGRGVESSPLEREAITDKLENLQYKYPIIQNMGHFNRAFPPETRKSFYSYQEIKDLIESRPPNPLSEIVFKEEEKNTQAFFDNPFVKRMGEILGDDFEKLFYLQNERKRFNEDIAKQENELEKLLDNHYYSEKDIKDTRQYQEELEHLKNLQKYKMQVEKELDSLIDKAMQGSKEKIPSKATPLPEFGENFAEFYHDGAGAIAKLMQERHGQVAGAFYREELGDISLVWGEAGSGKSDGYGLAKIVKFHPEVVDKLDELVHTLPISKQNERQIILDDGVYKIAIRKNWQSGEEQKDVNWIVTGFEKTGNRANLTNPSPATREAVQGDSFYEPNHSTTNPLNDKFISMIIKFKQEAPKTYEKVLNNGIPNDNNTMVALAKQQGEPADLFANMDGGIYKTLQLYLKDQSYNQEITKLQTQISQAEEKLAKSQTLSEEAGAKKQIDDLREILQIIKDNQKENSQKIQEYRTMFGDNPLTPTLESASKELQTSDMLSPATKEALEKQGLEVERTSAGFDVKRPSKEPSDLQTPQAFPIEAQITKEGYSVYNEVGAIEKKVIDTPESHVKITNEGAYNKVATTDKTTGETTLKAEFKDEKAPRVFDNETPAKLPTSKDRAELAQNYIINPDKQPAISFENNITAIKILKDIEANHRLATPEEKQLLASYVGFGGLSNKFKPGSESDKLLRELLSEEEYNFAKASTLSAYYTPYNVVSGIWHTLQKMGFNGGNVLEPSVGIGNFIGLKPAHITADIRGFEIDPLTAGIAQILYPQAHIKKAGFETISSGNYDLIIGNPPYGDIKLYDKNFKEASKFNIHNYFLLKSADLLAPDGMLAQVVTKSFLDTPNPKARELLAQKMQLIGAVRLPEGTFKDTGVSTDILFFRRLKEGEKNPDTSWTQVVEIPDPTGKAPIPVNAYFTKNPQYFLGDMGRYGGQYGDDMVRIRPNGNTTEQMSEALELIAESHTITPIKKVALNEQESAFKLSNDSINDAPAYIKSNSLFMAKDGNFYRYSPSDFENPARPVSLADLLGVDEEKFASYTPSYLAQKQNWLKKFQTMFPDIEKVRGTLVDLKNAQLDPEATESQIGILRSRLNKEYDSFVKKYNTRFFDKNLMNAFDGDPLYPHLLALEVTKRNDKKQEVFVKKADIFSKRTQIPTIVPTKASNIIDAKNISLDQTGTLDLGYMANLLGKNIAETSEELLNNQLAFKDASGHIIEKNRFLSGDVRAKLASFENKDLDMHQEIAKKELQAIIPPDVSIVDVSVRIGANYIPAKVYEDFAKDVLEINGGVRLAYDKVINNWDIAYKLPSNQRSSNLMFAVKGEYKEVGASEIFANLLNRKNITMNTIDPVSQKIRVDEKGNNALNSAIERMNKAFKDFIVNHPQYALEVERLYNDVFNAHIPMAYDGSHLKFPGMTSLITLRAHQKNAIYRSIQDRSVLLDHAVGTGKTFTMAATAMELRRLGLAKKPMIIAPNHIVPQFAREFQTLYPNANILATMKFDSKSRQKTLASIATGDWDAVIVGHFNMTMMPVSKEAQIRFINKEIAQAREIYSQKQGDNPFNVKNYESFLAKNNKKLQELLDSKKDQTTGFEELGVDALFVDEAHEFKNLAFATNERNIAGIGNTAGSKKATDLYMKTNLLRDNDKKIVFATGTPISNSATELWTMQRYLDPETLEHLGLEHFDQWLNQYGKVTKDFEMGVAGAYKEKTRLRGYENLPELYSNYTKFADIVSKEDVANFLKAEGKPIIDPQVEYISVVAPRSKEQEAMMAEFLERGKAIESKSVRPEEDNMLKITNDGKKASLDMRTIDPSMPDFKDSKINLAVQNILKDYKQYDKDKGTQIVFIDASTPKSGVKNEIKKMEELYAKVEKGEDGAMEAFEKAGGFDYMDSLKAPFSVYDDIKEKLIKAGIPENEIAFIHDFDDAKGIKKAALFAKVNSGDVRVLLGSTPKLGTGTNVQERIVAVHNIDAPWRPADIEQRNGRAIRQGNKLMEKYGRDKFKVKIYTYATKDMFDQVMFEKLATKQKIINSMKSGKFNGRNVEIPSDSINFEELQAVASGNPKFLERLQLNKEVNELQAQKENIQRLTLANNKKIAELEAYIPIAKSYLQNFKEDIARTKANAGKLKIGTASYDKNNKAHAKAIAKAIESIKIEERKQTIYNYNGLDIEVERHYVANKPQYTINAINPDTGANYTIANGVDSFSPSGTMVRVENFFSKKRLELITQDLKTSQERFAKLKKGIQTFEKEAELKVKQEKLEQLNREIIESSIQAKGVNKESGKDLGLGAVGAGIIGGAGSAEASDNDDSEGFGGNALLGALGGIVGLKALKYLSNKPEVLKRLLKRHFPNKDREIAQTIDSLNIGQIKHEKRGIYNVTYNGKNATYIRKDLENIEDVLRFERGNTNKGARHIKHRHLNLHKIGHIQQDELLNLGNSIRSYIKEHKEPFIDEKGHRIYEWENKEGVRFRVIAYKSNQQGQSKPALSKPADEIITFYSDRNLKDKMVFKNPKLQKSKARIA
ncbi:DEAD/DEAH box helicase family protein [Helicobacter sp. 11S02596-1]|uniref:putative barnase/colicin E5 family endoribonuclease n=1 Tax=Helicobacter sp. 11S02596-1 TaxID=1476194 RepID=UPI001C5F68BF|nr:DEAD/DEAH box helicase family protein [Helicobacter sp. 11S02596-1]